MTEAKLLNCLLAVLILLTTTMFVWTVNIIINANQNNINTTISAFSA